MAEPKSSKNDATDSETPQHRSADYIDMVLRRKGAKVIDSETLIKETQKRLWGALKQGYEYENTQDGSKALIMKKSFDWMARSFALIFLLSLGSVCCTNNQYIILTTQSIVNIIT